MNRSTLVERRSPLGCFPGQPTPRLYDRVVEVLRARHYSPRTEEAYLHWIRRFTLLHAGAHPRELGEGHVSTVLTHLAVKENVAASTQNQALAALLFRYGHVLEQPLNRIEGVIRARKPKRLPVVLTSDEVEAIPAHLNGVPSLVCTLLYGSGLRLLEGLQLRVKNLDFGRGEITVRDGKGQKDRVTMLPDDGYDIRTVQELLGHKEMRTTMIYTHVLNRGGHGVHSPLDRLRKAVGSESTGIMRTDGRPNKLEAT